MKTNGQQKKMTVLSVVVLLAVLALNVGVGILCEKQRLYTDLTEEQVYTVDPMYFTTLDTAFAEMDAERSASGEEPVKVEILFCEDPDVLTASDLSRYVYFTALSLQKKYPQYITVKTEDIWKNPSAVQKYRVNSASTIYPSNVIVSSGTEFRVYGYSSFFYFGSDDDDLSDPNGYCGDKTFTKGILSVTRAESPVCCLISNHGETYSESFISLLSRAGYEVVENFDLSHDAIPEDCRVMISVGATEDFYAKFGALSEKTDDREDEIDKLDRFLDENKSFLWFFDPDTPKLRNLEEYLADWGVKADRDENGNCFTVSDDANRIGTDATVFAAQYEEMGVAASMLGDLLNQSARTTVLVKDSATVSMPKSYKAQYVDEEDETSGVVSYLYRVYTSNGISRSAYNLLTAGNTATATSGEDGIVSNTGSYPLMTITQEYHSVAEDKGYTWVTQTSNVLACASTSFLDDGLLDSSLYANTDVMLAILRTMGKEPVAADNSYRFFHESDLGTVSTVSEDTTATLTTVLTVVPLLILCALCAVTMIRRRNKA